MLSKYTMNFSTKITDKSSRAPKQELKLFRNRNITYPLNYKKANLHFLVLYYLFQTSANLQGDTINC